jgi:CO/xanthine dehydrogenase FAD-binding subunit
MRGQRLDEKCLTAAMNTLRNELELTSDFRVSQEYRLEVACNLFKRALNRCAEELTGEKAPV